MYVNSATCTNTFLPTGTVVGSQRNAIYFLERQRGAATILNRAILPERTYDAEELAAALQAAMAARRPRSGPRGARHRAAGP